MKKEFTRLLAVLMIALMTICATGYAEVTVAEDAIVYSYEELPLERNGISLHLDRIAVSGTEPSKSILLVHGLTYSSHEFDMNYQDYSLVRLLAREGYAVWRLDVAGYGRSGAVEDGFMPDSDYAAEDICAAVEAILDNTGLEKIDVLGWSWGTVTSSRFAANHPEYVNKLVLYAPILNGLGEAVISDAFHVNDWEHAASDFQLDANGDYDLTITDPVIIEMYCSSCWHYDGYSSPNGGRRDLCVDPSVLLIDLESIATPTLVICGDSDPYLNMDLVNGSIELLPEGSSLEVIPGASHCAMIEKPFYHDFQNRLLSYLAG
ncbi:MAG: alpha/beta hydrolase [Clostridia bacterium]|nr:alpha/beta hydrolase [Clostridia bacterium]